MERFVVWHRIVPSASDDPPRIADIVRARIASAVAAGATLLGQIGGSFAVALEPHDMADAVELGLRWLREGDAADPLVRAAIAVAYGDVYAGDPGRGQEFIGQPIERAQLLANRCGPSELVLDPQARELAHPVFLFARQVPTGQPGLRGHAIDRNCPRRRPCRLAIRHLRKAQVAGATLDALAPAATLAKQSRGVTRLVLRAPASAGASAWLSWLEGSIAPPLVLRIAGVPAALEPLGSLRLALLRIFGDAERVGSNAGKVLGAIARGCDVGPGDATDAMRAWLRQQRPGRPWIVLSPVTGIDPATLRVLGDLFGNDPPDVLVVARMAVDAQLPSALQDAPAPHEFILPSLRTSDARAIADWILGEAPDEEVARRLAVLGGDTPLGVEEAARSLIALGEIVWNGVQFVWRTTPRPGVNAVPSETFIEERLMGLDPAPRRLLEILCILPDGSPPALVEAVAALDGLNETEQAECLAQLRAEALITDQVPFRTSSLVLRQVLLRTMPPARAAELHRFAAEPMRQALPDDAVFARATVGYFLAEGGHEREGARLLLDAGVAAARLGYDFAAVRLAAAAAQFDSSDETREGAVRITRVSSSPPTGVVDVSEFRTSPLPEELQTSGPIRQAIAALRGRDLDAVERHLEEARASGQGEAAIARVRALAYLVRGDPRSALVALSGGTRRSTDDPRETLARAVILLQSREPHHAIRAALRALSHARELVDAHGERAALKTLSACYRAIGRDQEADSLERAAS